MMLVAVATCVGMVPAMAEAQQGYFARQRLASSAQKAAAAKTMGCDAMVMTREVIGTGTGVGFVSNAPGWEAAAIAKCIAIGPSLTQCGVMAAGSGKSLWSVTAYSGGRTSPASAGGLGGGLTPSDVGAAECGMR